MLLTAVFVVGVAVGVFGMRWRYQQRYDRAVLAVNGSVVTREQFLRRLEQVAGAQVARQLVGDELQLQFAEKNGLLPTDAEVQARYDQLRKDRDFAASMSAIGLTRDDLKRQIRVELCRAKVIGRGVTVTDEEVRRFYRTNADPKNPNARFHTPETVRIRVIVTQTEAAGRSALAELRRGEPWSEVVQKYSKDQSRDNDGLVPPMRRGRTRSARVPGMESTIFGLRVGQMIGPVRLAGAWWIIQCLDKTPASTRPFEEVKEEARMGAMVLKGLPANQEQIEADFRVFQREARIQSFVARYVEVIKP